jgi:DNA polymerase-3 subunit delta'
MLFKQIIGQQDIKKRLLSSVKDNRISHAQLFLGAEGSGALALAVAYAQNIACNNKQNDDSCGVCASCIKFEKLIHPDLHFCYPTVGGKSISTMFAQQWRDSFLANPYLNVTQWLDNIEAENKQGNITVEECHDIIRKLSLKTFESEYKFLILWMPEYLGLAGNSLLKIIEEPPPKTLFLLVGENSAQIISTITSRTQLIKINKLPHEELKSVLVQKHSLSESEANILAHLSNGSYNEALINLQSDSIDDYSERYLNWMRKCFGIRKNIPEILNWSDEMSKIGREKQKAFLAFGMHICRECLMINYGNIDLVRLSAEDYARFKNVAPFINKANGQTIFEELNTALYHIERNANPKILFTDLSLKIGSLLHVKA